MAGLASILGAVVVALIAIGLLRGTNFPEDIVPHIHETYLKTREIVETLFYGPPTKTLGKTKETTQKSSVNWVDESRSSFLPLLQDTDIKFSGNKLFLVILGHVFDVSDGYEYYKPGSGYHGFIGRDASRSFVTGDFKEEGLISDVSGLASSDYIGLADWVTFYLQHGTYRHVGYHVGRFFDANGKETEYMKELKGWVNNARKEAETEDDLKKLFPACNMEWSAGKGTKLSCSEQSGGTKRDWSGVPRQFHEGTDKQTRCACVHPNYLADPRVKKYEGCDPQSSVCSRPE